MNGCRCGCCEEVLRRARMQSGGRVRRADSEITKRTVLRKTPFRVQARRLLRRIYGVYPMAVKRGQMRSERMAAQVSVVSQAALEVQEPNPHNSPEEFKDDAADQLLAAYRRASCS